MKAEVLCAEPYEYTRKGGDVVRGAEVTFLDRCPNSPMKNTFDIRMDGQSADSVNSQLRGKVIDLDVTDFEIWSGRLRASGKLANVSPKSESKAA